MFFIGDMEEVIEWEVDDEYEVVEPSEADIIDTFLGTIKKIKGVVPTELTVSACAGASLNFLPTIEQMWNPKSGYGESAVQEGQEDGQEGAQEGAQEGGQEGGQEDGQEGDLQGGQEGGPQDGLEGAQGKGLEGDQEGGQEGAQEGAQDGDQEGGQEGGQRPRRPRKRPG